MKPSGGALTVKNPPANIAGDIKKHPGSIPEEKISEEETANPPSLWLRRIPMTEQEPGWATESIGSQEMT